MKVDRTLRIAAVILVAALSLKLRHDLQTQPVTGDQWPSPAALDSLRPHLRRTETPPRQIPSLAYDALSENDPFQADAPVAPAPEPSFAPSEPQPREVIHLRLSAILISGAERVAVVNNALVRVGSSLPGGGRVVGIERDHVQIVSREGGRTVLRLNQGG